MNRVCFTHGLAKVLDGSGPGDFWYCPKCRAEESKRPGTAFGAFSDFLAATGPCLLDAPRKTKAINVADWHNSVVRRAAPPKPCRWCDSTAQRQKSGKCRECGGRD